MKKKRSYKRKSKRSYKRKSKRSYKRKSKRSYKKKLPKFNLIIDYGVRYNNHSIDSGINYDFKLIELEKCPACINAKKLIKDKGYSMDVKKELNAEETQIIKDKTGGTYDFFPKIFKYNDTTGKYDFVGGYDTLQTII